MAPRTQSYQEVAKEVIAEIRKERVPRTKLEYQSLFWELKQKQPARFERLVFDENQSKPFISEDLGSILFDYIMAGILTYVGFDQKLYLMEEVLGKKKSKTL